MNASPGTSNCCMRRTGKAAVLYPYMDSRLLCRSGLHGKGRDCVRIFGFVVMRSSALSHHGNPRAFSSSALRQANCRDRGRLKQVRQADLRCQGISEIPGVGVLTASAAVAAMGDPHSFRCGMAADTLLDAGCSLGSPNLGSLLPHRQVRIERRKPPGS